MPKALSALALALALVLPSAAPAATGYVLRKVALSGEAAPGTSDLFAKPSAVAMNKAGQVAFLAPLSSGPTHTGAWVDTSGALALRMQSGDPAPGTGGGHYSALAGFPQLDLAGGVAVLALVSGGTTPRGIFLDTGGSDTPLLLSGAAAPPSVGGTLSAGLADLQPFGLSPTGTLLFRSAVSGGSASSGVFLRYPGGTISALALVGGSAPGASGATFGSFTHPAIDALGRPAFCATLVGGSATRGLFADTGSGLTAQVLSGSSAPGTGGGTFSDFQYPAGGSGAVAFLGSVSGSSVTGGVFLADGGVVAAAVENQVAPGTGGGTFATVNSPTAINLHRSVSFSAGLSGGASSGGVFVYDANTAALAPPALAGDVVPGVSSPLASFGHVAMGGSGAIVFVADLADGRSGVFVATPEQEIPGVPAAWGVGLALWLAVIARAVLRRSEPGKA